MIAAKNNSWLATIDAATDISKWRVCVRLIRFSRATARIVDAQEKAMLSCSVDLRFGSASQSESHPAGYEQSLLT
jgi:hypothetical protein